MLRGWLRLTRVACDGRNRFPVDIKYTQTRKANDRKRVSIMKENMRIIREGRAALMRRLYKEQRAGTLKTTNQVSNTAKN